MSVLTTLLIHKPSSISQRHQEFVPRLFMIFYFLYEDRTFFSFKQDLFLGIFERETIYTNIFKLSAVDIHIDNCRKKIKWVDILFNESSHY